MSDWDIFDLEDGEWFHLQILDRLHEEGVDCYFVDMFHDDLLWITGYSAGLPHGQYGLSNGQYEIATALNIPEDVVYYDADHGIVFVNLYQLKAIRSGCSDIIEEYTQNHGMYSDIE